MTKLTIVPPVVGEKNTVAEPKVGTNLKEIEEFVNSNKLDGAINLKAEGIKESNLEKALQEKIAEKNAGLSLVKQAGSETATAGNFYLMETNGATLTLPAATLNRTIGIACLNGVAAVKLKMTGKLYGDFINGSTEVVILENQHLIVKADGTNWHIESGEPKREQKYEVKAYTVLGIGAGIEYSASRPAMVTLLAPSGGEISTVSVGGVATGFPAQTVNPMPPLYVPPTQLVTASATKSGNALVILL